MRTFHCRHPSFHLNVNNLKFFSSSLDHKQWLKIVLTVNKNCYKSFCYETQEEIKRQPCQSAEKEHVAHGWLFSFQSTELGSKISTSKW